MNNVIMRYLEKVVINNRIVDSRGVMQVNRMIAVELKDIYISLNFQVTTNWLPPLKKVTEELWPVGKAFSEYAEWLRPKSQELYELVPVQEHEVGEWLPVNIKQFLSLNFDEAPLSWTSVAAASKEVLSLNDLWLAGSRWVILGDPGAGKSTLLKYLSLQHAQALFINDKNSFIPITVTLRNFGSEWKDRRWSAHDAIIMYVCTSLLEEMGFSEEERNLLRAQFIDALKGGRMLLLFDGLDEQRDASIKRETNTAIQHLLSQFPNNRCIVTSRIIGYDSATLDGDFRSATLQPFDRAQISQFFKKWFYAIERSEDIVDDETTRRRAESKAAELMTQIDTNEAVGSLAANPLLCTIIGLIYRQGGATLPTLRAELYKLCIDTFIFNWEMNKIRKGIDHLSLDKDETQAALEAIALYLHENSANNAAPREELVDIVNTFLIDELAYNTNEAMPRAQQLLDLARDVAGLLIERGHNRYGFFHLSFQEYLTARAITRKRRLIEVYLGRYLFSPRWREVMRLAAAHQGMKDEESGSDFVNAILSHPHQREKEMQYAFRIAYQCAAEGKVELETSDHLVRNLIDLCLYRPELEPLLPQMEPKLRYRKSTLQAIFAALASSDNSVRGRAVEILGYFNTPDSIEHLINALTDESNEVRRLAALSLGRLQARAAVKQLVVTLSDVDDYVRAFSAEALGEIKDVAAIGALLTSLKDERPVVSFAAARALGSIQSLASIPALIEALNSGPGIVSHQAAHALSFLKCNETITALINVLTSGRSDVKWIASRALRDMRSVEVVIQLKRLIEHENLEVGRLAVEVLHQLEATDDETVLLNELNSPNPNVRVWASGALGRLRCRRALNSLLKLLEDDDPTVRMEAVEALGELHEAEAVQSVMELINDTDQQVRSRAARALGKLKSRDAVACLIHALEDADPVVRREAAEALGELKSHEATAPLIEALGDDDSSVRATAIAVLGDMGAFAAVGPIIQALTDDIPGVRLQAAKSLGILKSGEATGSLIKALRDEDFEVRWEAAESLESVLKTTMSHDELIQALRDTNPACRGFAAMILGQLKAANSAPDLLVALNDDEEDVRMEAAAALGELNVREAIDPLLKIMSAPEEQSSVRIAAAEAIDKIDMSGEL